MPVTKKYILPLIIALFHQCVYCQNISIDSMQNWLAHATADTAKLMILHDLIENITDDSVWIPYNNQMGILSQSLIKNNNPKIQLSAKKYYAQYLNNIGYALTNQSNFKSALEYYHKGLKIQEEIGDKRGMAETLNNMGVIYHGLDDKQQELENFTQSLKLQKEVNDTVGMARSLNNIGSIYDNKNNLTLALDYYQQSLKMYESIDDKKEISTCLSNIGGVYDKQNDLTKALEFYKRSLKIQEETNDEEGLYVSNINFGNIYLKQKNFKEAEKYFLHSMAIAKQLDNVESIRGAANWLSKIYAAEGKYKDAFDMHVLFKNLTDSIRSDSTRNSLMRMQADFEFQKKEALLKADQEKKNALANAEIKQQRLIKTIILISSVLLIALLAFGFYNFYNRKKETFKRTVEQVNNKALVSQMNPHFIFNSLNSIQDFINSNDSKNANSYLVKFAKLVRMILENSRKQEILLSEDLKALELYMQLESLRLKIGFDYEIKIETDVDADSVLIPPLIIQPFVENAIWHGLQHKTVRGKILISFRKKEQELECMIEDNGVGRQLAQAKKSPSIAEKKKSLGMEITRERIQIYNSLKKAKAFFEIKDILNDNHEAAGVRVILRLPYEESF